ncbi:MAG: hypothetical protein ABEN55_21800, partial [Bradymonadaceae bacterium]
MAKATETGAFCDASNECGAGLYCNLPANECQKRQFASSIGAPCPRGKSCSLGLRCMPDGSGGKQCRTFSTDGGSCIGPGQTLSCQ